MKQEYPHLHSPALRAVFKLPQLMNNLTFSDWAQTELQYKEKDCIILYVFMPCRSYDTLFTSTTQKLAVRRNPVLSKHTFF